MRCVSKCDSLCNINSLSPPPKKLYIMYLFYGQIKLSMNWLGWKISLKISNRPNSLLSLYSRYCLLQIVDNLDLKIFVLSLLKHFPASHIPLHHIFHYRYFLSLLIYNNNFTYCTFTSLRL